jgi:hypothetical protein
MNGMYSADQIQIPSELGTVVKLFTKAAIREQPDAGNLYKWAANYFAAQCQRPAVFDPQGRITTAGAVPPRNRVSGGQMMSEVIPNAGDFESVAGADDGARYGEASTTGNDAEDAIVEELRAKYDPNATGSIPLAEVPALIQDMKAALGLNFTDEQMQEFINLLEPDEEDLVGLDYFMRVFFQS